MQDAPMPRCLLPIAALLACAWLAGCATAVSQTAAGSVRPVAYDLGPEHFGAGDSIEIEQVLASSAFFGPGTRVIVRGRYVLRSEPKATLALLLTHARLGPPRQDMDSKQALVVANGAGRFRLECVVPEKGLLRLTFYDRSRRTGGPVGWVYFGTTEQMARISRMPFARGPAFPSIVPEGAAAENVGLR
jgi:hypothetical protein